MIYTINKTDIEKLQEVSKEMETLGSPKIRAIWCGDHYRAIEGSHRIAAASALGVAVEIIEVEMDDVIENHDLQDLQSSCTVEEIMDYCDYCSAAYDVEII
jgi:hypothetical protein